MSALRFLGCVKMDKIVWPSHRREILTVVGISALLIAVQSFFIGTARQVIGDPYLYFIQSLNPLSVISPPHGLRWLTPRIAYLAPCSIVNAYYGITLAALAGTLALSYINLRIFGCCRLTSAVVLSALLSNPGFHDSLFYYIHVDPLSFFFIELGILAIYTRNDRLFAISLLLGILNRETSLFLIPVYHFAQNRRWREWNAIRHTLALCSAALIAFILTRFFLFTCSDTAYMNNLAEKFYLLDSGFQRFDQYYWGELKKLWSEPERWNKILSPEALSGGFQSIVPLAMIGFWTTEKKTRALLAFLLCVWTQIFYALMVERLMFYTFPVYLIGCGVALRSTQTMKPIHHYSILCAAGFLNLFLPQSWVGGIFLALLPFALQCCEGRSLFIASSLSPSETETVHNSLPLSSTLRASFSRINVCLLLLVLSNLAMIYYYRPELAARIHDSFPSFRHAEKMSLQDSDPVYLGDAGFVDFQLPDRKQTQAFSVNPGADPSKIFIPLRGTQFKDLQNFILVNVVYPTAPGEVNIAVVGPRRGGNPSKLLYKYTTNQKYGAQQRMGLIRKSLPLFFESDSPDKDYLVIRMTPSVLLLDVLIFQGDVYTWFQRKDNLALRAGAVEIN